MRQETIPRQYQSSQAYQIHITPILRHITFVPYQLKTIPYDIYIVNITTCHTMRHQQNVTPLSYDRTPYPIRSTIIIVHDTYISHVHQRTSHLYHITVNDTILSHIPHITPYHTTSHRHHVTSLYLPSHHITSISCTLQTYCTNIRTTSSHIVVVLYHNKITPYTFTSRTSHLYSIYITPTSGHTTFTWHNTVSRLYHADRRHIPHISHLYQANITPISSHITSVSYYTKIIPHHIYTTYIRSISVLYNTTPYHSISHTSQAYHNYITTYDIQPPCYYVTFISYLNTPNTTILSSTHYVTSLSCDITAYHVHIIPIWRHVTLTSHHIHIRRCHLYTRQRLISHPCQNISHL